MGNVLKTSNCMTDILIVQYKLSNFSGSAPECKVGYVNNTLKIFGNKQCRAAGSHAYH